MIKLKYLFIRNYRSKTLKIRPHVHDCYEFVYYFKAQGRGSFIKGKENIHLGKDLNLFYLNDQNIKNAEQYDFTDNSYAIFEPYTVHDEQHEIQANIITFGFYLDESCPLDVKNCFHKDGGTSIFPYVKQIRDEYMNKFSNYENMICSLITQLITILYRKENKQINNNNEIAIIKNYIDEYYTTNLSISKLAALSHYSEDHFCLKFKNAYNVSPKTYIVQKRIELAKNLLTNTTLPLNQVALQCGYEDYLTFTQIFKNKVGVSPKKFQSQLKQVE